jgi:hypothetical protein
MLAIADCVNFLTLSVALLSAVTCGSQKADQAISVSRTIYAYLICYL